MVTEYVELDVEIEPGMVEGQEIVYHGEGEPHVDGARRWPTRGSLGGMRASFVGLAHLIRVLVPLPPQASLVT